MSTKEKQLPGILDEAENLEAMIDNEEEPRRKCVGAAVHLRTRLIQEVVNGLRDLLEQIESAEWELTPGDSDWKEACRFLTKAKSKAKKVFRSLGALGKWRPADDD